MSKVKDLVKVCLEREQGGGVREREAKMEGKGGEREEKGVTLSVPLKLSFEVKLHFFGVFGRSSWLF